VWRTALAGAVASLLPGLVLVFAWSLEAACNGVGTGLFLRTAVGGVASPLWFPAAVFLVAGATAFATGTSWATMAILIPTATPIAYQLDGGTYGLVTVISLAAVLDGAIFGDHCSPISDTTILSSAASGCAHVLHVRTQAPYGFVAAGLALGCGYVPAALGVSPWLSLLAATAATVVLFLLLRPVREAPAEAPTGERHDPAQPPQRASDAA
jgi:Na+/H+ antiporter NhaC